LRPARLMSREALMHFTGMTNRISLY
jgi:hypothetical protein